MQKNKWTQIRGQNVTLHKPLEIPEKENLKTNAIMKQMNFHPISLALSCYIC